MATIIRTGNVGIRETFGRFTNIQKPGFVLYIPFVQKIYKLNTQINQVDLKVGARTTDDVFSDVELSIQFAVDTERIEQAFYSFRNPVQQIISHVENSIRTSISKLQLKELFADYSHVSQEAKIGLASILTENGYTLKNILITNIIPNEKVRIAMNEVSASARRLEAAANDAEAKFIKDIKNAEAERQRKVLIGQGISEQRAAILNGFQKSITSTVTATGISPDIAAEIALRTQELDTNLQIGTSPNTKILFLGQTSSSLEKSLISAIESR